jgi:two-component system phosphate regulon sensor histidine kinase PhoR
MRFLWRNAIFILFPAMVVAIVFLAMISVGTAVRFGEWGERSVAESTLVLTKDKIERVEEIFRKTDDAFFKALDPRSLDTACEQWLALIEDSRLVQAAFILDSFDDIVEFYYRDPYSSRIDQLLALIKNEIVPLVDKYDSFDQYKHIHKRIDDNYYFIAHLTVLFEEQDYTICLIYDTETIVDDLLDSVLGNVGPGRIANVVDDKNDVIYGHAIDGAGEFIVSRRFPSTLYKWRLQLEPTSTALFSSEAQKHAKRVTKELLIPLALAVILLGLIVLYLSVVRERRLNRLKSEFVANVSHELKTPLSLIQMFGELLFLGKAGDEAKARSYHEIILRETERLTTLIDNVLNLARIERGKGAYDFVESDIGEAIERAVEICSHRLEKSGIELKFTKAPDIPLMLIDDRAITLAVVNLVDNAVKYAQGTDIVGVELSADDRRVYLDVYDRGIGIPKGHVKRIFERFYRIPSVETRKQRGSGIGLSLVRHIVEGHGGVIVVKSDQGVETRFSIRLPIHR